MNEISKSDVYADAGVDITAGYKAVELMKKHIARTLTSGVCSDVGGFGGLFELDLTGITKPVLCSRLLKVCTSSGAYLLFSIRSSMRVALCSRQSLPRVPE